METVIDFIFLGCKITVDGDSSHEIKRLLLLGRKVLTILEIKKQDYHFADKGPYSQSCGFSSSRHTKMRTGPLRRLSAEELMLSNCGPGEDTR